MATGNLLELRIIAGRKNHIDLPQEFKKPAVEESQ